MRELRAITFTPTEVIQAILLLAQRTHQKMPTGQISGVRLFDGDPPHAKLTIVDDYGNSTPIERSAAELAAALVAFCIDRRVRLPAQGNKFVEVVNGDLTLFIVMDGRMGSRASLVRPRHAEIRKRLSEAEAAQA